MKNLFTILFAFLSYASYSQIVPGQSRQVTIAGTVCVVKAPSDTTVANPLIIFHPGSGVSDSTGLANDGDSTLSKRVLRGWWNGKQAIPGNYTTPQTGDSRDTADFWIVMIAQQNGWPPSLDDLIGNFISSHNVDTSLVSFHGWSAGGAYAVQYKTKWNLSNNTWVRKVKKFILAAPGYPNVGDYSNFTDASARILFDSSDNTTGEGPAYIIHNSITAVGTSQIYDYTGYSYGHSGVANPAWRTTGTSAITNNIIWLIDDEAGNPDPPCANPVEITLAYDNVIDLEGASNYYYDSVLYHFKGRPTSATAGERQVFDIYNDSAFYPTSQKGRHILVAFDSLKIITKVEGIDSSGTVATIKAYHFRNITASSSVHSTYDSILNSNAYTPNYSWSTSGGGFQGSRVLQDNMNDTSMYWLFTLYETTPMAIKFTGCTVTGANAAKENLILPVPDTITYTYKAIGNLTGSNVTQIGSVNFLADTLKWEKPTAYKTTSPTFRFYDHPMYYDTSTSTLRANWRLVMNGAGNLDSVAAVTYGLRSVQSTRGGQGKTVAESNAQGGAGTWELRQTNTITDNPSIIDNYYRLARFHTQMTAKKGRNTNIQYTRDSLNYVGADTVNFGLNINTGREIGNEEDKDWLPRQTAKPQHVFAKLAACYDADRGRLGSKTGIHTIDTTMDVIYPGVVSFRTEWVRASITWSKLYYGDRTMPFDAIGYHLGTSNKQFTKSPTSAEVVGVKGTYPEYYDDATRLTYVIHLFSRLIGKQARLQFNEYAVSQEYEWPKIQAQVGSTSVLATPLFGSLDNLTTQLNVAWYSAAINTLRQFLVIAESPADASAGYEFHDNSGYRTKPNYGINDQSNGKYTIAPYPVADTVALWPRFFVVDGFWNRAANYKFEEFLVKTPGGAYISKWRSVTNPDSIMVIARKMDTTGSAVAYTMNVAGAPLVYQWIPSYTNLLGTQSSLIPSFSEISASADLMPRFYFFRETVVPTTGNSKRVRIKIKPNHTP